MFARVFGRKAATSAESPAVTKRVAADPVATLEKLREAQRVLESRQTVLKKKVADEVAKAQDFVRRKDRRGALKCLKLKAMYEKNLELLENQQLNLENQMNVIESAKTASDVASAMALGGAALKQLSKGTSVESVDRVMDEIHEATDRMAEVQNALAQPVNGEMMDEDALDAELAELEALELDAELLGDTQAMPTAPTSLPLTPARVSAAAAAGGGGGGMTAEELELEALQQELGILA